MGLYTLRSPEAQQLPQNDGEPSATGDRRSHQPKSSRCLGMMSILISPRETTSKFQCDSIHSLLIRITLHTWLLQHEAVIPLFLIIESFLHQSSLLTLWKEFEFCPQYPNQISIHQMTSPYSVPVWQNSGNFQRVTCNSWVSFEWLIFGSTLSGCQFFNGFN